MWKCYREQSCSNTDLISIQFELGMFFGGQSYRRFCCYWKKKQLDRTFMNDPWTDSHWKWVPPIRMQSYAICLIDAKLFCPPLFLNLPSSSHSHHLLCIFVVYIFSSSLGIALCFVFIIFWARARFLPTLFRSSVVCVSFMCLNIIIIGLLSLYVLL